MSDETLRELSRLTELIIACVQDAETELLCAARPPTPRDPDNPWHRSSGRPRATSPPRGRGRRPR